MAGKTNPREERETTSPTESRVVLIIAGTGSLVSCVSQEVTSWEEPLPEPLSREAEERRSPRSKGALGKGTGLRRSGEKGLGCGEVGEQSQL